jgi:hypothetical protein
MRVLRPDMRGLLQAAVASLALTLALSSLSQPAAAQSQGVFSGLFQGLFGEPKSEAPPLVYRMRPPQAPFSRLAPPPPGAPPTLGDGVIHGPTPTPQSRIGGLGGSWRTMCVRICDGYYWPVTYTASRSRFAHDAKICSASCSSEARLFYMPADGEAGQMVDLSGQSYSRLKTAFLYRKKRDESCACRPPAWSPEARARHETLALDGNTPPTASPNDQPSAVPPIEPEVSEQQAMTAALAGAIVVPSAPRMAEVLAVFAITAPAATLPPAEERPIISALTPTVTTAPKLPETPPIAAAAPATPPVQQAAVKAAATKRKSASRPQLEFQPIVIGR